MTVLRPILNVRELPPSLASLRKHLPSLRTFLTPQGNENERHLLDYMAEGVCCGMYGDPLLGRDVFKRDDSIETALPEGLDGMKIGPQSSYTDGIWVWWGALMYYIAKYHVQLPEEFVRHAEQSRWHIDSAKIDISELDDSLLDDVAQNSRPPTRPQSSPIKLRNGRATG